MQAGSEKALKLSIEELAMKIGKPEFTSEDSKIVCKVRVDFDQGSDYLWFAIDASHASLLTTTSDPFLVALLVPAMIAGEDIYIDGAVSSRLLFHLSGSVQRILRHVMPGLKNVGVFAADATDGRASGSVGVGTGFSGGVDSFCTLADHYFSDIAKPYKITHLFFNNLGSHLDGGEELFEKRYQRLLSVTDRFDLPFVQVNSNLNSFYGRGLTYQLTHTLRNASVALLAGGGIMRYLYSSTFDYTKVFVGPTYDIAYTDPILLPLLSADHQDLLSVGSQYTRVEKTLRVAATPESYDSLDICFDPPSNIKLANCSRCSKCLRTLATLEIAGCLENYSEVFDLEVYRSHRWHYFTFSLLASPEPLLREIVDFAEKKGFLFPFSSRFLHRSGLYSTARGTRRLIRKTVSRGGYSARTF